MYLKDKEIYIIDDDQSIQKLLGKILENQGAIVKCFSDIDSAEIELQKTLPNLVILDLNFGEKNKSGYDFLKDRLSNPVLLKVPFIVLSSHNKEKHIQKTISYRADDFIPKPINASLVQIKLKQFFKEGVIDSHEFKADKPAVKVKIPCSITQINEISVEINAPVKLNHSINLEIESDFIKKITANQCKFMTTRISLITDIGFYKNTVKLIGSTTEVAKRVRKFGIKK